MKILKTVSIVLAVIFTLNIASYAQEKNTTEEVNKLMVVWSSDDPMVAERVALMYAGAAKQYGLFEDVSIIIWGPSAKLVAKNKDIQAQLKGLMDKGVKVSACITCANMYKVTDKLKALGINVDIMGAPLTNALKATDISVLTF